MKKLMLMTVVALAGCAAVADYVLDFSYSSEETKWKRDTRVITDVNIASKNFTLEAWVYRRSDQNGYKIFAQYPSTTGTYSLFLGGANGKADTLDVFFRSSIGWWTPGVPLTRNAWHHVALVKDDTGVAVLYVDGEEKARVQDDRLRDFYPNQTDQKLWLGNTYSDGTGAEGSYSVGFPGYLCEMRCWNVARTGDEIRAYLHRRLNGDEAGLVGYWPLNEGGGAAVVNRRTGVASAVLGTGAWKSDDTMSFVNRRDMAFDAGAHEVSVPQNLSEGDVRYLPAEGARVVVSGKLTGHGAVVVNGAETSGEVEFTGDNDFSGGLTVTRGRFKTADFANIGPGAVDILMGTFAYTGTAAATFANAFYFRSGPGRNAILLNVGDLTLRGPLTCFGNKEGGFV
ncbi:MAG: LamG-like jellyroll fold domain-containing protein, partial [Kiritimatiellia bacterium]